MAMDSQLHRIALPGLLASALLLSGCASAPRNAGARAADRKAARAEDEESDAALDRRVRAIAHFAAGISAELNDDESGGLDHYLKSAAADPGHEVLVLELARRLIQNKQPDRAVDLLTRAAASPRATGKTYAWLGLALAEADRTEAAIKADQTAISKAPDLILGYRNLFSVYQVNHQPEEALRVLDRAAVQSSDDPEFWADLADMFVNHQQLNPDQAAALKPRAIAALDRAAGLKPQNLLLLQRIADGYKALGEFGPAESAYLQLLDRFPALPGTREKLADIYLRTGRKEKAAEQLEAISRDNPRNEQAYYFLGNLAYQERRLADAADYFQQALVLKPEYEPVYYRLAEVQVQLDKPRLALEVLERARSRFRPNFVLEFLTAVAHSHAKEYGEAVKHFTQAEVIAKAGEPDSLTYLFYFQFGAALERNGETAEAERYFRKCLELSPRFAEAMNYLGYMWAERGENLDEARKLIEKAVEMEPDNAAFLDSMGWVLFKLHQPREALGWLQKAVEHSKEPDPTLYDHLGDIHAGLNQFDKACDAWRKSVELEPNDQVRKKIGAAPARPRQGR